MVVVSQCSIPVTLKCSSSNSGVLTADGNSLAARAPLVADVAATVSDMTTGKERMCCVNNEADLF